MINSYIILKRKTSIIIKFFIINIILLIGFIIWGINTFYYQTFNQLHSKILYINTFYYMEVLVPVKEVKQIMNHHQLIINSKKYNYEIYKIDTNAIYINKKNYQKVYLEILNLDKTYQINSYELDIKILKEKKKIINHLKDIKEENTWKKWKMNT